MNLTPVYDLRDRLRASLVAGAALVSEDFRLQRALEAFAPYEKAAPVFARIGQQVRGLLAPDCPDRAAALVDAITLMDAVLATQAVSGVSGEVTPLSPVLEETGMGLGASSGSSSGSGSGTGCGVSTAPYSLLCPLVDALNNGGPGAAALAKDMRRNHPELFSDFRVQRALAGALDTLSTDLADLVQEELLKQGAGAAPLVCRGFNPKGGRGSVRRIRLLAAMKGAAADEIFLQWLPEAEGAVRAELISWLGRNPARCGLIQELCDTEKGPARKAALWALARMNTPEADAYWTASAKRESLAIQYGALSTSAVISEIVGQAACRWIAPFEADRKAPLEKKEMDACQAIFYALPGKSGPTVVEAYRRMLELGPVLDHRKDAGTGHLITFRAVEKFGNEHLSFSESVSEVLRRSLLVYPAPELASFAREQKTSISSSCTATAVTAALLTLEPAQAYEYASVLFKGPENLLGRPKASILEQALQGLRWDEDTGRMVYQFAAADGRSTDGFTTYRRPLRGDLDPRWFDVIPQMKGGASLAETVYWCLPKNQPELCHKVGAWLFQLWKNSKDLSHRHLEYLRSIGWDQCDGLAVAYCTLLGSRRQAVPLGPMVEFIQQLPGSAAAKKREGHAVLRMLQDKKFPCQGNLSYLASVILQLEDTPQDSAGAGAGTGAGAGAGTGTDV